MVDASRVRELLHYDPDTGLFTWRSDGRAAGCKTPKGYIVIGIDGALYLAHRLAVLYGTGKWPIGQVDHKDQQKDNNRYTNLREATASQNAMNTAVRATNRSGFRGISWDKANHKWRATLTVNGKQRSLGRHEHLEDAVAARQAEVKAVHGDYAATELGVTFYDLQPH